MNELVDKMSKLSIYGPAYAKAYFKAIFISSQVEKIFSMPVAKESNTITAQKELDHFQMISTPQRSTDQAQYRRQYGER